jgi:hypothetical protein
MMVLEDLTWLMMVLSSLGASTVIMTPDGFSHLHFYSAKVAPASAHPVRKLFTRFVLGLTSRASGLTNLLKILTLAAMRGNP